MRSVLLVLWTVFLAAFGRAQERSAVVTLDDGRVLKGRVVPTDISSLKLNVNGELVTIPASKIASCHFEPVPGAKPAGAPQSAQEQPTAVAPEPEPAAPGVAAPPRPKAPVASAVAPEVTASDPTSVPADLRNRSRWKQRIEAFDASYPWLAPAAPTQWISLGLFLFAALSLMCHLSVRVSGAEHPSAGRCMGLALWYLVSGLLQIAFVPGGSLALAILLLANPALAVYSMRLLFGMTRPATIVALAVQLGLAVVGWGALSLVDAILASTSGAS